MIALVLEVGTSMGLQHGIPQKTTSAPASAAMVNVIKPLSPDFVLVHDLDGDRRFAIGVHEYRPSTMETVLVPTFSTAGSWNLTNTTRSAEVFGKIVRAEAIQGLHHRFHTAQGPSESAVMAAIKISTFPGVSASPGMLS